MSLISAFDQMCYVKRYYLGNHRFLLQISQYHYSLTIDYKPSEKERGRERERKSERERRARERERKRDR